MVTDDGRGPPPPTGGGGDRAPMGCSVQGHDARRLIGFLERGGRKLAPFQKRLIGGAMAPGIRKAILSGPRGLGKSSLTGELLAAAVDPAGPLFRPGGESVLLASSLDQARLCFGFLRRFVGEDGFRFQDSGQRVSCTHVPTRTRVRVASSDAKRAFGLGANTPIVVGDEPAAWLDRAGSLMYDALETSGGKADMRLILIGTRAPAAEGNWWRSLVDHGDGSASTYRQVHDAPVDDEGQPVDPLTMRAARRANPLIGWNPHLLPELRDQLRKARQSEDAFARWCSYRLNRPVQPARSVLFTVQAWRRIEARPAPDVIGRPVAGVDIGSSRSWTAGVLLWPNGRAHVCMVAPGIPDLDEQERRDGMPAGAYRKLVADGVLLVDEGRRVVRPERLIDRLLEFGPSLIVGDEFRRPAVADAIGGRAPWVTRRTRWSEITQDIGACRKLGHDGGLTVTPESRRAFRMALSETEVEGDDDGNVRLTKRRRGRSRDDLCVALVMSTGAMARCNQTRSRGVYIGAV